MTFVSGCFVEKTSVLVVVATATWTQSSLSVKIFCTKSLPGALLCFPKWNPGSRGAKLRIKCCVLKMQSEDHGQDQLVGFQMAGWLRLWQGTVPFPHGCSGAGDVKKKEKRELGMDFSSSHWWKRLSPGFASCIYPGDFASGQFLYPVLPFAWRVNSVFLDPCVGMMWMVDTCVPNACSLVDPGLGVIICWLGWEEGAWEESSILIL